MADSRLSRVETIGHFAQWRINSIDFPFMESDPFKIGLWNWRLIVEKARDAFMQVSIVAEPCEHPPPLASYHFRVSDTVRGNRLFVSPAFEWKVLNFANHYWVIEATLVCPFTIDVEFLDLKIGHSVEARSIWPMDGTIQSISSQSTLRYLSRILDESIHTDVTIHVEGVTLRAHKAILSASSLVFQSMFRHNLVEKSSSEIHMNDMSLNCSSTFLSFLYGTIKNEDFWEHRLELLKAAHKYVIGDLKDACEESLMEDTNTSNVLNRLEIAWLYQLNKLRKRCFKYLFGCGKMYDIRDKIDDFVQA